tara:strand:+ start:838 stop:1410 length:573 start_codon:yes stop_codon:yes gene_type:complete
MKIKIIKMKCVQSTNNIALKLIKKKKTNPTLITSIVQTNGKGTMGKKWISKKGNLFISIFFEIKEKKINFKQYALLNAYLFKDIITKFTKIKIDIKWPNDLLIKKEKICGILQEIIHYGAKTYLIVGVGINTNISPIIKNYKVTSLNNVLNKKIDNSKLLRETKKKYEKFIQQIEKNNFTELKRKILKLK